MSNLVLFSSYGGPDLMMAGTAVLAMFCGIILMGGRSIVALPLRMFLNRRRRRLRPGEPVIFKFPGGQPVYEQDAPAVQPPMRRTA